MQKKTIEMFWNLHFWSVDSSLKISGKPKKFQETSLEIKQNHETKKTETSEKPKN